jgi:oligopeptide transport system ATP-binding protein
MNAASLLEIHDLTKKFPTGAGRVPWSGRRHVQVLNGISLHIKEGEVLGLVGESGCGKSTTAKIIMNIYKPTTGGIWFRSFDLGTLKGAQSKKVRKDIQYVFQDPMGALNPRVPVIEQICEPMIIHYGRKGSAEYYRKAMLLLESVGMNERHGRMYPHQLSGGQRQRVVLARAMILDPRLLICDEPIAALDVSIQAQVVNLLIKLKKERHLTMLFISHDLSMVRHICDRTAVMYMGNIVEMSDNEELFDKPLHPYTRSLIDAIPIPDPRVKRREVILEGEIPSLAHPPSGCRFHPRCPVVMPACRLVQPELREHSPGREVACHHVWKRAGSV